jgi:predicted unusual protein kinase regulating ubiquinone biosynthesis (AarF/ABC1/UbiB family)
MLFDQSILEPLVSGMPSEQLAAMAGAFLHSSSTGERISAVEAAVKTGGPPWRTAIGQWISTRIVPAGVLVPDEYQRWRPLVQDSMQFVFSRLSDRRLATKLVEQIELPPETPHEQRLIRLISKMPGLQKLGQVLARNRRLSPALREALSELENGMSDVAPAEIRAILEAQLASRLESQAVEIDASIFREGSAGAVVRFTWQSSPHERRRGIFKVLKPYVPSYFGEDMTILQQLAEFLSSNDPRYAFAVYDVQEMLAEVRQLLEHELDFPREQATLTEALRGYRSSIGIRVPQLIAPLSTAQITAMTEEDGVKVTDACRRSPIRRGRIAEQVIEALIAVPLFSRQDPSVFHADPHAGNLLYDEPNRELVVIDWALAERMTLESRRQLAMLALMMNLRNREGVQEAIYALSRDAGRGSRPAPPHGKRVIDRWVARFFAGLPSNHSPGALDAMHLLDEIALEGVHFPASLFLFRKIVFTLDGVLHDIAGSEVRMDTVITREFLTRWISSFGLFHSPLSIRDLAAVEWQTLRYSVWQAAGALACQRARSA